MVGEGVLIGGLSYVGIGKEVGYGDGGTATAGIDFLSSSLKAVKSVKVLEEIQSKRTNSHAISLGKVVAGDIEGYYSPRSLGFNILLQNAFGGAPVTTVTATGDTAGAATFQHQFDIGNFVDTYSSLCINERKGDSVNGKVFEYSGIRVNELTLKASLDEALMLSAALIAKDVTVTANDISAALSGTCNSPLSFVGGRFSVESSLAGLTSTSFWEVQDFTMKLSNNLNSDASSRRIGSDTLQVLPAGLAQVDLKATVRFDTTTAYDAMMAGTQLSCEFMFEGSTLPGSTLKESIRIVMPVVMISDAGDPEISGPNDPLQSQISFTVLRDCSSAGGYMLRGFVISDLSSI